MNILLDLQNKTFYLPKMIKKNSTNKQYSILTIKDSAKHLQQPNLEGHDRRNVPNLFHQLLCLECGFCGRPGQNGVPIHGIPMFMCDRSYRVQIPAKRIYHTVSRNLTVDLPYHQNQTAWHGPQHAHDDVKSMLRKLRHVSQVFFGQSDF